MAQAAIDSPSGTAAEPACELGGLWSASFLGLLVTQLLGAANDNMFRWLVIGIGKDYVPREHWGLIISGGMVCFVVPYLLLAAPAGYLADRFSKRSVIVCCKAAEIVVMTLGIAAIFIGGGFGMPALLAVLFLLGSQSALFSPSKLGSIPELVRPDRIASANGLVGLTTVIATVIGAAGGNYLYDLTRPYGQKRLWASAAAVIGVAALGWVASLFIRKLAPANPGLRPPRNVVRRTINDLGTLARNRPLVRVALGIAFFWSVGALAQSNIDQFGAEGGLEQKEIVPLLISLVVGVGLGSVLAGVWSGGRVELGILPLGAGGVAASSMLLFTVQGSLSAPAVGFAAPLLWACLFLFTLGVSAGLFDIPLASYMQHRSPADSRGAILAASNFLTFFGILLAAGVFLLLRMPVHGEPWLSARQIFLLSGIFTIPVFAYVLWLLPQASIRFVFWLASLAVYRMRIHGRDNLPMHGGALLVSNHVTWIDGVLLLLASPRPIRMVAKAEFVEVWWLRGLARIMGVITIRPGRKSMVESLKTAREALLRGEMVCIFPEGGITPTGQLMPFRPGLLWVVKNTGAPVIPVYLDELWGSIFSFERGKFFWKRPRRWPYPVSVLFGRPMAQLADLQEVQSAVADLGVMAMEKRKPRKLILPRAFLRMCRRSLRRPKVADSTGQELTGGSLLVRTLILRQLLGRKVLGANEKYVGLLLPPSVAGVLANAALSLLGRIAVNLNYTVSSDLMNSCIQQCGIRHVLTSRRVVEKLNIEFQAQLVYLEDFRDRVTAADKAVAALQAYLMPARMLERVLGLARMGPDDVLTVIFTSGSTGEPKGVMLTHENVGSNIEAIDQLVRLGPDDVLAGILPFFHSFGYTTTLWTILALPPKGVYHTSPLEARQVGDICRKHRATILIATPTFLRTYLKRCPPEDFAALDVVLAGAEKLPTDLCDAFEKKFGVRPVEGYGATELAPLVAVNIPLSRAVATTEIVAKEGTVGRPVPRVSAKVVHPETGEELGPNQPGMLWIKGPNVMRGYLHQPELTAQVVRDGWYITGDIAVIDGDGFIRITGRESRFSKIGGEMVPHIKIEETLQKILSPDEEELKAVVTSVPDARKGERLVVMHTHLEKSPGAICKELAQAGLPNLWIPSPDSFCQVDEIPVLGTGKLDLKGLKALAREKFGSEGANG